MFRPTQAPVVARDVRSRPTSGSQRVRKRKAQVAHEGEPLLRQEALSDPTLAPRFHGLQRGERISFAVP